MYIICSILVSKFEKYWLPKPFFRLRMRLHFLSLSFNLSLFLSFFPFFLLFNLFPYFPFLFFLLFFLINFLNHFFSKLCWLRTGFYKIDDCDTFELSQGDNWWFFFSYPGLNFWKHRVYGMQKNKLGHTVSTQKMINQTDPCGSRYRHKYDGLVCSKFCIWN